jgi:hypothetical protein
MRLARRSVAVVLQLLLLQVSLMGSGVACAGSLLGPSPGSVHAAGRVTPRAPHSHGAQGAAHHARADASGRVNAQSPPAEHGRAPDPGPHGMTHCGMSVACAALALAAPASALPEAISDAGRAPVTESDAPHSATTAPEPPPPRP